MAITINGTNGITFPDSSVQTTGIDIYGDALLEDVRANGTSYGATTASAWTTRVLNTLWYDTIGITLSSNQFTPASNCWADICLTYSGTSAINFRVYNVSQSTSWFHFLNITAANTSAVATGSVFFNAGETYRIEYYTTVTTANLNGVAASIGRDERYARLLFRKYA